MNDRFGRLLRACGLEPMTLNASITYYPIETRWLTQRNDDPVAELAADLTAEIAAEVDRTIMANLTTPIAGTDAEATPPEPLTQERLPEVIEQIESEAWHRRRRPFEPEPRVLSLDDFDFQIDRIEMNDRLEIVGTIRPREPITTPLSGLVPPPAEGGLIMKVKGEPEPAEPPPSQFVFLRPPDEALLKHVARTEPVKEKAGGRRHG